MNKNDVVIFSSSKHPLHHQLKELDFKFFDMDKSEPFEDTFTHFMKYKYIFDFSLGAPTKKNLFLKLLNKEKDVKIFSELACYNGEKLFCKYDKLAGGFACAFPLPNKKFEYSLKDPEDKSVIDNFFSLINLQGIGISSPGIGMIYPRTIAMIINEAYFAIEENLASTDEIDEAMKFGVNYPEGPFAWARKIGLNLVVQLLDQLYFATKDLRYRVCPLLKLQSISKAKEI